MTPNDGSNLCQSCGLCCDGTLFAHFELVEGESAPREEDRLTRRDLGKGKLAYKQPCTALRTMSCSIYSDRPRICRTYKCRLLKAFERADVTLDEAIGIIAHVKHAKSEVTEQIGPERAQAIKRLKFLREAQEKSRDRTYSEAKLAIGILEILIDRHFRDNERRQLLDSSPSMPMPSGHKGN